MKYKRKKNTKIMLYHVIVDEILPVRLAIANNNVNIFFVLQTWRKTWTSIPNSDLFKIIPDKLFLIWFYKLPTVEYIEE